MAALILFIFSTIWALMERFRRQALESTLQQDAQNRAEFWANLTSPYLVMSLDPYDRTVAERAAAARDAIESSGNLWKPKVIERIYIRFNGNDSHGQTWCDFVAESLKIYLDECRDLNRQVSMAGEEGREQAVTEFGNQRKPAATGRVVEWEKPVYRTGKPTNS